MSFSGPFDLLRKKVEQLEEIAKGKAAELARATAARAALQAARAGWDAHESPDGRSWRPGMAGSGTLEASGRLRNSLRVERKEHGFSISVSAVAPGGGRYAGTQQYGRTIRAKGDKPMRWRSRDGRWHSAMKVRVPARPFLPKRSGIPPRWAESIARAIRLEMERYK